MSGLHASCTVTISPTIVPERLPALTMAVIDKLFPGNSGGVQMLYGQRVIALVAPLVQEAAARQQTAKARIVRNGLTLTIEPVVADGWQVG